MVRQRIASSPAVKKTHAGMQNQSPVCVETVLAFINIDPQAPPVRATLHTAALPQPIQAG